MFIKETPTTYLNAILNKIQESTNISKLTQNSFINILAKAIAESSAELSTLLDNATLSSLLPYATGEYLDLIGQMFNVQRFGATTVSIQESERNFKFYVSGNRTFGEINNGESILIPSGTEIYSNTEDGNSALFFTIKTDIILPADSRYVYFSAESVIADSISTGVNTIINHSFTNYFDSINNSLLVTNEQAISSGRSIEDDNSYRYRISKSMELSEAANEYAVLAAAYSVPGVSDVKTIKWTRGIGTGDLYIQSTQPFKNDTLIQLVENKIQSTVAFGNDIRCYNPRYVGIELECSLTFTQDTYEYEYEKIRNDVKNTIVSFLNNTEIGVGINSQQLLQEIRNVSQKILRVGTYDIPFSIFKKYIEFANGNRISYNVIGDINIKEFEKIVVEYSIENPIRVL